MKQHRRVADIVNQFLLWVTPGLLGMLFWFMSPIIRTVPELEKHMAVMIERQQEQSNKIQGLDVKLERADGQQRIVEAKIGIVENKLTDLERDLENLRSEGRANGRAR